MNILELKLYTNCLLEQTKFYTEVLGVNLVKTTERYSVLQLGKSRLVFEQSKMSRPYHFAINISTNKIDEALLWLDRRVKVLKYNNNLVQDFVNWNAKAIYFYDVDHNIVEFIARGNLEFNRKGDFDADDLLEISEIGLPVEEIQPTYNSLNSIVPLKVFDGGFDRFCAIGDERGLFICINKNKKTWFPTGDKAYSSRFEILIKEKNQDYSLEFQKGILTSFN